MPIFKPFFFALALLTAFSSLAQQDTASHWKNVLEIEGEFEDMVIDRLGHIYLLKGNHEVKKMSGKGQLEISESFRNYGELTHLDATNPLAPHFFFKNQAYVLITDNKLAEKAAYDLNSMGVEQAEAVCRAAEGGIWVFDVREFQLKYFTQNKQQQRESENLYLYFDDTPEIVGFVQQQSRLYIGVKNEGIYFFDIMGVYEKKIERKQFKSFNVHNELIYYWTGTEMRVFNTRTFADFSLKLPKAIGEKRDFKRIIFKDKKLYLLDQKKLQVFQK